MKPRTWIPWVAVAALLLSVAGCLELGGQRIAMRYDAAADRLAFLLLYDGIHNSDKGSTDAEQAEKKLREFVANGDAMLLDWFGVIDPPEIEKELKSGHRPRLVEFGKAFLASYDEVVLGRYRDTEGRLGVAQLVTLDRAKALVAAGNAAISEAVLAVTDPDERWPRTTQRWKELAARGHGWLSIDGHSLVWRCEVDPLEWTRGKLEFFAELSRAWEESTDGWQENLGHRLLAAAALSLSQSGDEVTVRLGYRDAPSTMRVEWRKSYVPNVEFVVQDLVPDDLDRRLAACLLDEREPGPALAALISWGPPEQQVLAVLGRARSDDPVLRAPALAWLEEFGSAWNARRGAPVAPESGGAPKDVIARWQAWYTAIVAQPQLAR